MPEAGRDPNSLSQELTIFHDVARLLRPRRLDSDPSDHHGKDGGIFPPGDRSLLMVNNRKMSCTSVIAVGAAPSAANQR